jgi:predicted nuclease of restriction endonuclease-like (RecB) superfamily
MVSPVPVNYSQVLEDLKTRVRAAQSKAATTVNSELIGLYLHIGKTLSMQSASAGWGDKVVERLAQDLRTAFPAVQGFSRTNVFYMRQVHEAWAAADDSVQQLVGQIPWGHHLVLLARLDTLEKRIFYLRQTITHGWSRAVLTVQIESDLHTRQGKAISNFGHTLPTPESELAQQTLKDPYLFDFLTLSTEARERDIEEGLIAHVQNFLLELGVGFAFVGRQVELEVSGQVFRIDLLFYHLRLRCFVVLELKAGEFKPEHAGKMNFYLSAVDDRLRHRDDKPSIGIILCKSRDRLIVEYALRDMRKPIGVSEWQTKLVKSLPKSLAQSLPSVQEIERELRDEE